MKSEAGPLARTAEGSGNREHNDETGPPVRRRLDPEEIARVFQEGVYPYEKKLKRHLYEREKSGLQVELLKVQRWVKRSGKSEL